MSKLTLNKRYTVYFSLKGGTLGVVFIVKCNMNFGIEVLGPYVHWGFTP
jgi:hypothetical protein